MGCLGVVVKYINDHLSALNLDTLICNTLYDFRTGLCNLVKTLNSLRLFNPYGINRWSNNTSKKLKETIYSQ